MEEAKKELIVRDWLAIERTKLANERTFLAYFRTAMVFLGTGIGILKIEFFSDISHLGTIPVVICPLILVVGVIRFLQVKKRIEKSYKK